jgi:hypothetical protein
MPLHSSHLDDAGDAGLATLTLIANSAQVVLLPTLAGGVWCITASGKFIGPAHRNRPWENVVMAFMFVLAMYGAFNSAKSIAAFVHGN